MRFISAITENIIDKVLPLERSMKGVDFQLIVHKPEEIKTYSDHWPENRKFYCTAQGGEFMKWVDYSGVVCLLDADMIMQRKPTDSETQHMTPVNGEFIACLHAYPGVLLIDSPIYVKSELSVDPDFIEIGAAMIIAHTDDWLKLREYYINYFPVVSAVMKHHATTQWLISFIIQKHFKLKIGSDIIHNARWYSGTRSKLIDGRLYIDNELVIFNHYKFDKSHGYL